jgi:hypothetical protein
VKYQFDFAPTTTPSDHEYTFTNIEAVDLTTHFAVFFGGSGNNGIDFYIDDIKLIEQNNAANPVPEIASFVPNGDFESAVPSWQTWYDSTAGAEAPSCGRYISIPGYSGWCLGFSSTNCGNNPQSWSDYTESIKFVNTNNPNQTCLFYLQAYRSYRLQYRISADLEGGRVRFALQDINPPFTATFYQSTLFVGTGNLLWGVTFIPTSNQIVQLMVFFGNTDTHNNNNKTFYIDDLEILDIT